MPIVITEGSELAKELAKWEMFPSKYGEPGRPYRGPIPYPKMLYKAWQRPDGKVVVGDPTDESVDRRCQRVVQDEAEHAIAKGQGWCETPGNALAAFETEQQNVARLAAEALYQADRMSEAAQRELKAANDATEHHVLDVVGPKRGRPRKVTAADTE